MTNPRVIQGQYFSGTHSQTVHCLMSVDDTGWVRLEGHDLVQGLAPMQWSELEVSPRVGRTARLIRLDNGASFQTLDNDGVDQWVKQFAEVQTWFHAHLWETRLKFIVASLVLSVALVAGLIQWGVPFAAERLAYRLPAEFSSVLAEGTLEQLDQLHFKPSQLPKARRQSLQTLFKTHLPKGGDFAFRLCFRQAPKIGANAFALPDGTVVITDELVALTEDDDELLSVLFHEMGHVEYRHALRGVIQTTGVYAVYSWLTGDFMASTSMITLLPIILTQSHYSRALEWEADTYALARMQAADMDPMAFARMMSKLEASHQQEATEAASSEQGERPEQKPEPQSSKIPLLEYLNSHPPSAKRIARFEAAALAWRERQLDPVRH